VTSYCFLQVGDSVSTEARNVLANHTFLSVVEGGKADSVHPPGAPPSGSVVFGIEKRDEGARYYRQYFFDKGKHYASIFPSGSAKFFNGSVGLIVGSSSLSRYEVPVVHLLLQDLATVFFAVGDLGQENFLVAALFRLEVPGWKLCESLDRGSSP